MTNYDAEGREIRTAAEWEKDPEWRKRVAAFDKFQADFYSLGHGSVGGSVMLPRQIAHLKEINRAKSSPPPSDCLD